MSAENVNEEANAAIPAPASHEQLQSQNETLTAANQELERKVEELTRVNGDLRNRMAAERTEWKQAEETLRRGEEKYRSLFASIDDGFCVVELLFDAAGRATDYRFLETNPAFERQSGLQEAVGRRAREFEPDLEEHWFEAYGRIVRTGHPERFENVSAAMGRCFNVYAWRYGAPSNRQVAILFQDTTERQKAAERLRSSEERQAFLLKLSDALRPLANPAAIQIAACRLLGEHLGVDRAYYVAMDEADGTAHVAQDYLRGGSPSLAGQHRMADFGWAIPPMRRGQTLVISDVAASRLVPSADQPMMAAARIAAHVNAPLVKDGTLVGALCVTERAPRAWTAAEAELVRETGERIWAAVERARAESALRESEARTRALAHSLPGGAAFIFDRQLRYVLADGEALRAVGFQSADFLGKTVSEAVGDALAADYLPRLRAALAGESFVQEHADHGAVYVSRGTPLREPATGEITGVVVMSYDITERKRAEETLRVREGRLQRMINVPRVGVLTFDHTGTFLDVNDAFLGMVGYSRAEFAAKTFTWRDFTPPEHMAASLREVEKIRRTGIAGPYEKEYFCKDGSRVWLMLVAADVGNDTIVEYAIDISDRKRVEKALRKSEEKYRATVNLVPALLWQADLYGNTIMPLARWSEYTGQTSEQTQGWGWLDATHPEDLPRAKDAFEAAFRDGTPLEIEQRIRRHDGQYRWFLVRHVPTTNEHGQVSRWYGAATDIDDLVRARAAAAAASEAKDHFLAVLSHELRTPLMPITMALAVLGRRGDLPEPVRQTHEMIGRNVALETHFIDDLLDVTRISRGKMELTRAPMDLHEAVRRAAEVSAPDLEAKAQRLTVRLEGDECWLHGDFTRLQQVFWNLLKNASKFTPPGGSIEIRSYRQINGDYVVGVTDTGIGLEAEALARVFAPFEQASVEVTRQFGGLGLGLAIAKASVEAHGGTLRASSPGPGRGATFTVTLPLAAS